jgi:hypothetical protein
MPASRRVRTLTAVAELLSVLTDREERSGGAELRARGMVLQAAGVRALPGPLSGAAGGCAAVSRARCCELQDRMLRVWKSAVHR